MSLFIVLYCYTLSIQTVYKRLKICSLLAKRRHLIPANLKPLNLAPNNHLSVFDDSVCVSSFLSSFLKKNLFARLTGPRVSDHFKIKPLTTFQG